MSPHERHLRDLRTGLLRLHKALIHTERDAYERVNHPVASSGQFLQLLLQDPWFAWLRPVSEMIVRIDEMLDADEPATPEDARAVFTEARALLSPRESAEGFAGAYYAAIQRDPAVVLGHAEVSKVLAAQDPPPRERRA